MARLTRLIVVAMLVLPLLVMSMVTGVVAQDTSAEDNIVAVVYDATVSADCRIQARTNGGPWKTVLCGPGSVIAADITMRGEAHQLPASVIIELSGDQEADSAMIDAAAQELHETLAPKPITQMACAAATRTINGSYGVGEGRRVHYTLNYRLNSDCSATNISDRARAEPSAFWVRSCSDGTRNRCYARNISLTPSWTGYYQVQNSYYGWQYTNQSRSRADGWPTYYGYWYFD